jgi:hypothetical protein
MHRRRGLQLAVLVWLSYLLTHPAAAQPSNDACVNAVAISASHYADTVVTTAATAEMQDPAPTLFPDCIVGPCADPESDCRGKSVWYVFTAPNAGTVVADTLDSDYDTVLSVYTGSCGSLQRVPDGCNDDDPLDGAQSSVSLPISAGTTYRFMISAFNNDGGNLVFRLMFSGMPAMTPTPTAATPTPTATPGLTGDANCDGRETAADLAALVILISTDQRAPCGRDDATGDGVLNADDIVSVAGRIFEP